MSIYDFDQQEAEYQRQRLQPQPALHTFTLGGSIFDLPEITPAVWGEGSEVLWAQGEALIIAGPSGVGKTTTAGQVVRGLILGGSVLGYPVNPCGKVLYLAMDRPAQIARSLRRHFHPSEREALDENLIIWKGPPPGDFAKNPHILADLSAEAGAGVVVVDSLKDAAIGLSEDAVGAGYNSARQKALAAGVEVLELHHQTKRGANGDKPNTLADVYGSTWITGGAGSVILLWGSAGDPIVELRHLKQPMDPIGPFKIAHDHDAGTTSIWNSVDPIAMIKGSRGQGITARDFAAVMFESEKPNANEVEKARRRLNGLAKAGTITAREVPAASGGNPSKTFHLAAHAPTAPPTQPLGVDESTAA